MKVIIISAGNVLHLIILIVFLVISIPFCAFTQNSASIVSQTQRDWSLSFHLGGSVGGPGKDIEEAMRMAGLDYGSVRPFFSDRTRYYPYSETEASWIFELDYLFKHSYGAGVLLSKSYGTTSARPLEIDYSVFTFAPTISIAPNETIRIGIGLAFHNTRAWKAKVHSCSPPQCPSPWQKFSEASETNEKFKMGFIIDFGVRFPKKSRFFGELKLQYRKVGKATIGPFEYRIEATEVNFDHLFIGMGFGFRWFNLPQGS